MEAPIIVTKTDGIKVRPEAIGFVNEKEAELLFDISGVMDNEPGKENLRITAYSPEVVPDVYTEFAKDGAKRNGRQASEDEVYTRLAESYVKNGYFLLKLESRKGFAIDYFGKELKKACEKQHEPGCLCRISETSGQKLTDTVYVKGRTRNVDTVSANAFL